MMLKTEIKLLWEKSERRFLSVIILISLFVCTQNRNMYADDILATVSESDIYHGEQEIDIDTGEPVVPGQSSSEISDAFNRGITYNTKKGMYEYRFGVYQDKNVYMSVANGMIVNTPVSVEVPNTLTYMLMRNGQEVKDADLSNIKLDGLYVLLIDPNTTTSTYLSFRIVDEFTNVLYYKMPEGFYIERVIRNGEEMSSSYTTADFSYEGEYEVEYACTYSEMKYSLKAKIDHTYPVLALNGLNANNKIRGPIDISDVEEGSTITILKDGELLAYTPQLTEFGEYYVSITDLAGNKTEYNFQILTYFTVNSFVAITLLTLCVVSLALYIIIAKKRLRVR